VRHGLVVGLARSWDAAQGSADRKSGSNCRHQRRRCNADSAWWNCRFETLALIAIVRQQVYAVRKPSLREGLLWVLQIEKFNMSRKVLLVEDHPIVADGLQAIFRDLEPTIEVLVACTRADAMQYASDTRNLSLILLERYLGPDDGFELILELHALQSKARVVLFSDDSSLLTISRLISLGAVGLIPKTYTVFHIREALALILRGEIFLPKEMILDQKTTQAENPTRARLTTSQLQHINSLGLTQREIDVLSLLIIGKANKVIARELKIAESTVKTHVSVILKVLQASNRSEAAHLLTNGYFRK
jgi:DNA-binding NarL/FixJ family response regulator